MKLYDVITIGSATQDTYISTAGLKVRKSKTFSGLEYVFPLGSKIPIDALLLEAGGGATNAAATFARFGLQVSVMTRVGSDPSGEFVVNELKKMNVATDHVAIQKGATAYSVIFLSSKGERSIFVYRGVTAKQAWSTRVLNHLATRWIYLTSLGGDYSLIHKVFSLQARGINIAWNPGKTEFRSKKKLMTFLKKADVVFVNEAEAKDMFGVRTGRVTLTHIRKRTEATVVVTYGRRGSDCFFGQKRVVCRVDPVQASDTTGAGDAFGSGFVAGILQQPGDVRYALTVGSANAMSVVKKVGAKHGLITARDLPRLKKKIHIT